MQEEQPEEVSAQAEWFLPWHSHIHDTFGPESMQFTKIFGRNCSLKRLSEFSLGTALLLPLQSVNTNSIFCVLLTGLCPDWESWDPRKPVDNAREAMQQADDWLGVPQVRVQACMSHQAASSDTLWMPCGLAGSLTSPVASFQGALSGALVHLSQFTHFNRFSLT